MSNRPKSSSIDAVGNPIRATIQKTKAAGRIEWLNSFRWWNVIENKGCVMKAEQIARLIESFAERIDSTLDASGGSIHERVVIMRTRDALQRYAGLHDVGRVRKVIEQLPKQLEAVQFPADLLEPIQRTCQRVVAILRKV